MDTSKVNITTEQRSQDSDKRIKYEQNIRKKLDELQAVKERLYQLRYDYSRPEVDIVRDVKNLSNEFNRIEDDIKKLRVRELANFEKSLNLHDIGLDRILTKERKGLDASSSERELNKSSSSISKDFPRTEGGNAGFQEVVIQPITNSNNISNSPSEQVEEHETMDFVPESEKLMRTKSTQSMQNMSAQQKWQSLFKMFKEWKHQTNVAEASQIVYKSSQSESVEEEIIKLRAALYSMKQRKTPSQTDRELTEQMTIKLRGLTKIASDLHGIRRSFRADSQ